MKSRRIEKTYKKYCNEANQTRVKSNEAYKTRHIRDTTAIKQRKLDIIKSNEADEVTVSTKANIYELDCLSIIESLSLNVV